MNQFFVKKSRKQQPQQILCDGCNDALGRQIFSVQMIDAADTRIRRNQFVREFGDGFHGEGFTTKEQRNKVFVSGGWMQRLSAESRMIKLPKYDGGLRTRRYASLFLRYFVVQLQSVLLKTLPSNCGCFGSFSKTP